MGRPKKFLPRVSTNVRFEVPLYERLRDFAAERDVSMSLIVSKALDEYLRKYHR